MNASNFHAAPSTNAVACGRMGDDGMEDPVRELMRTNDVALVSAIEALLTEAGIPHQILDRNMSVIQGSIGAIPQRILVANDYEPAARELLAEAGLTRAEAEPTSARDRPATAEAEPAGAEVEPDQR